MVSKISKRPVVKTDKPTIKDDIAEKFIKGAPDAQKVPPVSEPRKGVMRGNREQISHTIQPDILKRVDDLAKAKGLTRAGLINLAISDYLDK